MIALTPSTAADADFIVAAESDPNASPFINRWTQERHIQAMGDPDCAHFIVTARDTGERLGFAMLFGVASRDRSIELRRIVITRRDGGFGRATLGAVKDLAFGRLDAHRLWLDAKSRNARARHLYQSEGFVEEGVLRECVLEDSGYESMVLMSMLKQEYEHFQASRNTHGVAT
jgi:RimJ/RimL family protein N-acetyltransferase